MASRRVIGWACRLADPEFVLPDVERRLFEADHVSVVTDDIRAHRIEALFRAQYADMAPALADRHDLDLVPVEAVRIRYDYHLRRVHADTLRLPRGARIRFSADVVNLLFAWIRNIASTLDVPGVAPESEQVVVSRVAKALDLATAPMLWTRQFWSAVPYHRELGESFVQAAERFVLAHEIAHIYLPDQVMAAVVPGWAALPRSERGHQREFRADAIGLESALDHARRFAARSGQPADEAVAHGAAGGVLALAAMDLLERFDTAYAGRDYPRVVIRRAAARARLRTWDPDVADRVEWLEVTADRIAGRALTMALRRRRRAAEAAAALLAGADGTQAWTDEEFDYAMRAALRHSHRGVLEVLAGAMAAPRNPRAAGFVSRFLVEWQGEPVYRPFLTDVRWEQTT